MRQQFARQVHRAFAANPRAQNRQQLGIAGLAAAFSFFHSIPIPVRSSFHSIIHISKITVLNGDIQNVLHNWLLVWHKILQLIPNSH